MTQDDNRALLEDAQVDADAALKYIIRVICNLNDRVLALEYKEEKERLKNAI